MAGISKITIATEDGDRVLVDLTDDNVTADSLVTGHTAHGADGEIVAGANPYELEPTNAEVGTQTSLIAQISAALEGKAAGGGGGSGLPTQEKTVEITKNGEHTITPDEGYTLSKVTANVNVPDVPAVVDVLEITKNGAYNAADEGLDGFSVVTVNVPDVPAVVEELSVTENGTYEPDDGVDGFSKVTVNVASSGGGEKQVYGFLDNTITAIDSDVEKVVAYACRGLSKIKTVNVPNAKSIGSYAFYYCTAMTSINAPKVTSLDTYVFYNCAIKSVNFPLATSVPTQCFYSCNSLAKADFGVASSIAASAFAYAKLETLILRRTSGICSLSNKNALVDTPIEKGTGHIYIPAALLDTYRAASNWSNFASQFRAIEDYPDICGTGV